MGSSEKARSDALKIAIDTENEGLEMYQKASEKASNPVAKKMFLGLGEDEKAHLKMIEEIAQGMGMSAALEVARQGTPLERMNTIFTEAKDDVTERLAASADEFEAIRIAMDFEERGYRFCTQAAKDAEDADQRALFERLAREENDHYRILDSTRQYLENTGEWNLWEEGGLLTGDMWATG